jgi:hypothetical protein
LSSFERVYGYAVSAWPRELVPRYTAIVVVAPERDPTARGLAGNVCQQREYFAALLPALAAREPAIIVIDKFVGSEGCTLPGPTSSLQDAVARVSAHVPVVLGIAIDEIAAASSPDQRPLLEPSLSFAKSHSLHEGIVNLDEVPQRIPLGWTVRDQPGAAAGWRDSISLAAALVREPRLFERAPRLQELKNQRNNPYSSMIAERKFAILHAAEVLCSDEAGRKSYAASCAEPRQLGSNLNYLRGRIVVVAETGKAIDQHDTAVIGRVSGATLQANYIEALLDDRYFVPVGVKIDLLAGFVFFAAVAISLHGRRPWISLFRLAMVIGTFVLLLISARSLGYFIDPALSVVTLFFMLMMWLKEWLPHALARLKGWIHPRRASS